MTFVAVAPATGFIIVQQSDFNVCAWLVAVRITCREYDVWWLNVPSTGSTGFVYNLGRINLSIPIVCLHADYVNMIAQPISDVPYIKDPMGKRPNKYASRAQALAMNSSLIDDENVNI